MDRASRARMVDNWLPVQRSAPCEAFGEAAVTGTERIVLSLGLRILDDLHVATEVGGVGVGLGELSVEPDGVVSGQLGELAEDCNGEIGSELRVMNQLTCLRRTHPLRQPEKLIEQVFF
jgi:hypothetical protein